MGSDSIYKKAYRLEEIDNATRFDVPIGPDHEFFTDFSDVRGDFEDRMVYRSLNVNPKTKRNDGETAKKYYHRSKELLSELVENFPSYVQFKESLDWVNNKLSSS